MATGLFGHARLSRHVLAGLFAPQSATLVVLLGGSGRITFHTLLGPHGHMSNVRSNQMLAPYDQQLTADIYRITARRVAHLAVLLERAQFWQEPAERQSRDIALDRAECLFEGVQSGAYHVALRWCPEVRNEKLFTELAQKLFDRSGLEIQERPPDGP